MLDNIQISSAAGHSIHIMCGMYEYGIGAFQGQNITYSPNTLSHKWYLLWLLFIIIDKWP